MSRQAVRAGKAGKGGALVPSLPAVPARGSTGVARGSGGDGGDRGGDDGGGRWGPEGWSSGEPGPDGRVELAFAFLLIGVVTLFVVFLAAWAVLRGNAPAWPGPAGPPRGLAWSTLVILLSSGSLSRCTRARAAGSGLRARGWLALTAALGLVFLLLQAWLWRRLVAAGLVPASGAYGTIFYALTGLHFLHVLGGLAYFAVLLRRQRGVWLSAAGRDRPLRLCTRYWHLLTGIWIVLFAVLYLEA